MKTLTLRSLMSLAVISGMFFGLTERIATGETVILKSGKNIEGKILEKTADYVRVDFSGVELKYYLDEIASIDTEPIRVESVPVREEATISQPARKVVFEDPDWGFSLAYPAHWQIMRSENLKKVMTTGFSPRETSAITIQVQTGVWRDEDLTGKATLADLIDGYLKPTSGLQREFIKPVTLRFETGYLVRYSYKTVEAIYDKNIEGPLYIPVKIVFDYYLFSPVFTSQGRDRRSFLIELNYLQYEDASTEVDSAKNRNKIYEWNSYYKLENKKTERFLWEATEIINSFHFSDKSPEAYAGDSL